MTVKGPEGQFSWDEVGRLCESFVFALRPMRTATKSITEQYSLGPRGAWMLLLISNGARFPLDLANVFRIGRSLITAELAQLTEAGLITSRRSTIDRRRMELALTAEGEKAVAAVRNVLSHLVNDRLSAYSSEDLELCSRIIRDFNQDGTPAPWENLPGAVEARSSR